MKLRVLFILIVVLLILDDIAGKTRSKSRRKWTLSRKSTTPRKPNPKPVSPRATTRGLVPRRTTNINEMFLKAEGGGSTRPPRVTTTRPPMRRTSLRPITTIYRPTSTPKSVTIPSITKRTVKHKNPNTGQTRPTWSSTHKNITTHKNASRTTSHRSTYRPTTTPMPHSQATARSTKYPEIGFKKDVYPQRNRTTAATKITPPFNNQPRTTYPITTNTPPRTSRSSPPPFHHTGSVPLSNSSRTTFHQGIYGPSTMPMPHSQATAPSSKYPEIGFKKEVYPQHNRTTAGTQFTPPFNKQPHTTYPITSNTPRWTSQSTPPPFHHTGPVPLGNPYGVQGGTPPAINYPQQQYTPQAPIYPFVLVQTSQGTPVQQDSGRDLGEMIKDALVHSVINAGVSGILNAYTRTHDAEKKPNTTPTTRTTHNNQHVNKPPGAGGATNQANTPQAVSPGSINQNAAPTAPPVGGRGSYVPNAPSGGGSSTPNRGTGGAPVAGSSSGNSGAPSAATGSASKDQGNTLNNAGPVNQGISYGISDKELWRISEQLYTVTEMYSIRNMQLNLQRRVTSPNITDEAKDPLFNIDPRVMQYPTIHVTKSLYDMYEYDSRKKFQRTPETTKQENLLLDTFLNTNAMDTAMRWLADRGFIAPDDFERKDVLRRIWFTVFGGSTCGFERIFAAENYGTAIIGGQDWIYFATQESQKRINYMGYVDKLDFGSSGSLLKLNFKMDGIVRQNVTILVGTMPELEMALYTICFYTRPNYLCPVSFAGTMFNVYTHTFNYFGTEVIDLALPIL